MAEVLRDVAGWHWTEGAAALGQVLLAGVLVLYALYLTILEVGGFLRAARVERRDPKSRFAILVPAHNEELVIRALVEALSQLDYPRELYDVYVVADNCTDATARTARLAGARVFERRSQRRGKGYALAYGWRHIRRRGRYDAMAVLDADNLVPANFLARLNDHLLAGHAIVQCRKESKNPYDNGVTAVKTLFLWTSDRFVFAPKSRLGLSSVLLGSGMCISTEVLERLGWRAFCLTEDFEFTAQALLAGYRVHWSDETVVYEEQPTEFAVALKQHIRWARGQNQVFFRYAPRLLATGLINGDLQRIEAAVQTSQSFLPVVGMLAGIIGWVVWATTGHLLLWERVPIWAWAAACFLQCLMPIPAYRQSHEADPRPLLWLWLYPFLLAALAAISAYALATVRHGRWDVTPHRRCMSMEDMDKTPQPREGLLRQQG